MSNFFLNPLFPLFLVSISCCGLLGQSVSVVLSKPAQRELTIEMGEAFLATREKSIPVDTGKADPFVGREESSIVAVVPVVDAPIVKAVVNDADLLQSLANRMPARGTAILGGDKFLLLGQKRLKVGDAITINFDGKDYEVWLTDVTSTTFTIKRNDLSYTRAVLIAR